MSAGYLSALAATVGVILLARLVLTALPLRDLTTSITRLDGGIAGIGVLGLVFHCGAMFFRARFTAIPGSSTAIRQIDAMGHSSQLWYAVSAVLVLLGLRAVTPPALGLLALAFVAVGITMYDGGALNLHLSAIFASVVLLAGITAALLS